jgi:hypothetical protein
LKAVFVAVSKLFTFISSVASGYALMSTCFALQAGAFTKTQLPKVALIFSCAVVVYFLGPVGWAILVFGKRGTQAVVYKTLFLLGLSGLSAFLLVTVISRGIVFRFGTLPYIFLFVPLGLILYMGRKQSTFGRM